MYGGVLGDAPQRSLERSLDWVDWLRTHPFAKIIEVRGQPVGHVRLHSLSVCRRSQGAVGYGAVFERVPGYGIPGGARVAGRWTTPSAPWGCIASICGF
ncbi:hypothetical protein SAMN04488094_105201 [Tropicimonas isoalkanivorans]|uniref:Uncharacterized protein n=1 Tax=Tropicimonas isoalkanivorans TaxID=441112 RepID=A0A1I1JNF4_9RHOB|nr:hypothetical protein SAMN04488094_105201 [Tropicimonas isoalkanivorans]